MRQYVSESAIDVLVRFARLVSEPAAAHRVLPSLADALVTHVGAEAVAIVEIVANDRTRLVESPHTPPELAGISIEPDSIGDELAIDLGRACHDRYVAVRGRPLVSGGGLFGTAVMFFPTPHPDLKLADGLIDMAAIALGSAAQLEALARSHAELRVTEEALARTEKLRALGQMAAGVAHDLKNILNPISLHLQFIDRAVDRGQTAEVKESVAEVKQVLVRGVQAIERLRDYSRQSPESRSEEIDLNRLAREAKEIARPRLASRGGVCRSIDEKLGEPPIIMGRSGDIVSAVVNLLVNAIDAIPESGHIALATGASRGGAWIEVSDDGPGMPPEVERRVFEPFFTTKGAEGTGLGLAMVYACMKRHGGEVTLETALGHGTKFRLWFPATAASPQS